MPSTVEMQERKVRREEKRAKQREASITRAGNMHDARLADQSALNLDDHLKIKGERPAYHIGCSGWFYWHWFGVFYPKDLPRNEWFGYYASHFKTVELNAPFNSWPTLATVKSWRRQAGRRRFIYTVKVCELITHQTFSGNEGTGQGFWLYRRSAWPLYGMFSFPAAPELPLYASPVTNHCQPARFGQAQCRGIQASQLVERKGVFSL